MEQIIFRPKLYKFDTLKAFTDEFKVGGSDLILTNRDIQWCDIGADIRFTCGTFVQRLIYILKESLRQAQLPTGQWNIRHARLVYLPNHCDRHVNEPSGQRGDIP